MCKKDVKTSYEWALNNDRVYCFYCTKAFDIDYAKLKEIPKEIEEVEEIKEVEEESSLPPPIPEPKEQNEDLEMTDFGYWIASGQNGDDWGE